MVPTLRQFVLLAEKNMEGNNWCSTMPLSKCYENPKEGDILPRSEGGRSY